MNWPEFFKAFSDAAVIIIIVLGATYVKILNTKLGSIQKEAKEAKQHAAETVQEVRDSRSERGSQINALATKATEAWDHANSTNDKLAKQGEEIVRLRKDITELVKRLKP